MNNNIKAYTLNIDKLPINIAIYKYDIKKDDFIFVDFNKSAEETEKIKKDALIGKYLMDVFPAAKEFGIFDLFKKTHQTGEQTYHKTEFYKDERVSGWRENNIYKIDAQHIMAVYKDLSLEKSLESRLQMLGLVVDSISEAVLITDLNANIIEVNPAYLTLTGFNREEIIGKNPRIFKSGKQNKKFYKNMWSKLLETGQYQGEIWDRKANGEVFLKSITINTVRDEKGVAKNYVGVFNDITREKNHEKELENLAYTDALTGLSNRVQFKNTLEYEINLATRHNSAGALLLLDLDLFKKVNDTLGHLIGDELLIMVAQRLNSLVRKSDTVSRIGGDEFTIIMASPVKQQSIQFIAQTILDAISEPFIIDKHEIFINFSIGISIFINDGKDANSIIKAADLAMYKAKENGRGNYQFFESGMHDTSMKKREIEIQLREALASGNIVPFYQPKVNPASGKVVGVEALVRWEHSELGILSPAYFLDVAEDSGLIHELGELMLLQSMQDIKELNDSSYPDLSVAVNLSCKQFEDDMLIQKIINSVKDNNFDVKNLELEITESLIMQDVHRAIEMMKELADNKIKISIDDFGTGYSSLNYLKKFPISYLKIDKSFIDGIATTKEDKAIVKTIISMAESLDIGVIAEGIETREQDKHLSELSCSLCQGYLYSKPLSFEDLKKFLIEWD